MDELSTNHANKGTFKELPEGVKKRKENHDIEEQRMLMVEREEKTLVGNEEQDNTNAETPQTQLCQSYSELDILCGRGSLSNNHSGNRVYRRLIESKKESYRRFIETDDKRRLVQSIVMAVKSVGGSFLKQSTKKTWEVIRDKEAFAKTFQAFREPDRKKARSRKKPAKIQSDERSPGKGRSSTATAIKTMPRADNDEDSGSKDATGNNTVVPFIKVLKTGDGSGDSVGNQYCASLMRGQTTWRGVGSSNQMEEQSDVSAKVWSRENTPAWGTKRTLESVGPNLVEERDSFHNMSSVAGLLQLSRPGNVVHTANTVSWASLDDDPAQRIPPRPVPVTSKPQASLNMLHTINEAQDPVENIRSLENLSAAGLLELATDSSNRFNSDDVPSR